MARRASLEIDLGVGTAPERWNAAWVRARVVEAYMIERRLPGPRRSAQRTAWPSVNYEFADVVNWPDARERVLDDWARTTGGVFAADIARMDQAQEWLRVHLGQYPVERLCLAQWATAMAYHRSLRGLLLRKRWSRTSFYRRVSAGAHIIALVLDANDEPVT